MCGFLPDAVGTKEKLGVNEGSLESKEECEVINSKGNGEWKMGPK